MSKLLTIQDKDSARIEHLMRDFQIRTQIDVLRAGLDLLEKELRRRERLKRWEQAVNAVAENSQDVNKDFQKHSRLKKV